MGAGCAAHRARNVMRMCICCEGGPVPIGACALWQRRSTARVIMAGAYSDARAKGAHARPHVEENTDTRQRTRTVCEI